MNDQNHGFQNLTIHNTPVTLSLETTNADVH